MKVKQLSWASRLLPVSAAHTLIFIVYIAQHDHGGQIVFVENDLSGGAWSLLLQFLCRFVPWNVTGIVVVVVVVQARNQLSGKGGSILAYWPPYTMIYFQLYKDIILPIVKKITQVALKIYVNTSTVSKKKR